MTVSLTLNIAIILTLFCLSAFEFPHLCESSVWFPILYAIRLDYLILILHLTSILFIKSELHCGCLRPLSNSSIYLKGDDIQYFLWFYLTLDISRPDNARER